ncbi:NfeD family protein [Infirmifilum sp. SLHALR2]|nr:MAG: hypothetical protein B7L53_02180 [Thermofilum sp. NZ13]
MTRARLALSVLAVILLTLPCLSAQPASVVVVEVYGNIDEGKVYLLRKAAYRAEGGALLVVINSYGGYLKSMDEMISIVKGCNCRVIAWVPPGAKAVSAATGVALAAGKLYLGEGAVIGACKPVPADEKVESYMVSRIKSLLEEKGVAGSADIAEKLVLESKALTTNEAVAAGIANGVANLLTEVLRLEGLEHAALEYVGGDVVSDALSLVMDPGVAILFMILGALLIALEFHVTGFQGWGVLGAVLVLLALYTFGVVGVNLLVFVLAVTGTALILVELLKPGVQLFGISGAALVMLALLIEYYAQPYVAPTASTIAIVAILGASIAFVGFIILKASEALRMKTLSVEERLLGKVGVAKTEIKPGKRGVVLVESEEWTAESEEEIHAGEKVTVVGLEGLVVKVRRVKN